jgi:hypothetical protein
VTLGGLSDHDVWRELSGYAGRGKTYAAVEQQTARPTVFFDRSSGQWRSTVLRSTCVLYGSYLSLRAMLVAAGLPFEDCPPKRWQSHLGIPPRAKGEDDRKWKNRLKARAQQLFPSVRRVTLATADALLIAEWCRRMREARL